MIVAFRANLDHEITSFTTESADNRQLYRLSCSAGIQWTKIGLFKTQTCVCERLKPSNLRG